LKQHIAAYFLDKKEGFETGGDNTKTNKRKGTVIFTSKKRSLGMSMSRKESLAASSMGNGSIGTSQDSF
jgi:hypothetical protein